MDKLLAFLNSLSPTEQAAFAVRCGTSIGYLRKAISIGQRLGEGLCINMERESAAAATCEELRPDVDWAYLRGSATPTDVIPAAIVEKPTAEDHPAGSRRKSEPADLLDAGRRKPAPGDLRTLGRRNKSPATGRRGTNGGKSSNQGIA